MNIIKVSKVDISAKIMRWIILMIWLLIVLTPLSIVLTGAFKTTQEIFSSPFGLPNQIAFENYMKVLTEGNMVTYYRNTIVICLVSLSILTITGGMTAFAVTRRGFRSGKSIYFYFIFGMTIPVQSIMVPSYLLMTAFRLVDNPLSLILVYSSSLLPFSVFIVSGFFRTIPNELEESANIDGANELTVFSRIFAPLAKPAFASIIIFNLLLIWNDFYNPLLYIRSERYKTITLGLLRHVGQYSSNYPTMFAAVVLASFPVILIFIVLQRYFESGITAGALKG